MYDRGDDPELHRYTQGTTDLHYKMCKKISQLTRVVHSLNMTKDDLEYQNQLVKIEEEHKCETVCKVLRDKLNDARLQFTAFKSQIHDKLDIASQSKSLETAVREKERVICCMSDDLTALKGSQDAREKALTVAHKNELEKYRLELEGARAALLAQSAERRAEVSQLKGMLDNLEKDKTTLGRRLTELKDDQGRALRERTSLVQQLEAVEEGRDKLLREVGTIRQQLEKNQKSKEQVEKTLSEKLEKERRNLVNQEARFQEQLAALTAQLTARDTETNKLTYKMEELQRDVQVKAWGMDRLQAELSAAHKESECVRQKLRKMENDVTAYRQKNQELVEELAKKAEEVNTADSNHNERMEELQTSIKDLETKMKELEAQLEEVRVERDMLEEEKAEMEAEREEEMKIVQEALEETQEEKDEIQARFEKDFERLRTVNTDREQQLLNDFEWKLREVEQACKRRLEEKDKKAEEKIATWQREMADKIKDADQQLKEAQKLKSFEAEATQLRGVTHDQQRSLRAAQRQTEQLQVNERMLKEEVSRLHTAIDSEKNISQSLQMINDKKVSDTEKKFNSRLEQQKSDLERQWEDKLRRECLRLKTELDKLHLEEKQIELHTLRAEKEQEMRLAKQSWELRIQDCLKQVATLTDSLVEKEAFYHKEIEKVQTNADRDILELRRKLDKMDMSYQEQIEKLNERHEQEMEQLNWETTRKIQQLEQNWQLQASSTRTTLELVKEQMERDTQDKLEALEATHREKIEQQWERLTQEKEVEVDQLQETHYKEIQKITEELQQKFKGRGSREAELMHKISALEGKLRGQCAVIGDLQGNADLLQGSVQVLNEQIVTKGKEVERTQAQAAQRIREREAELEAEWGLQLAALEEQHSQQVERCQAQHSAEQRELTQKIDTLAKLLEESRAQHENRVSQPEDIERIAELTKALEDSKKARSLSQPEDIKRIADLMNTLAEREQELSSLTEEKRFYQLELINRETTYNQIFRSQPVVGVIDPLQYANGPRKKGGGRGNPNPNPNPQHVPSPPRLVPKSPRKHKKGGGGNMTPAQVLRSKSLDFKPASKSKTKHKNTHTATVAESPEENLTVSTL